MISSNQNIEINPEHIPSSFNLKELYHFFAKNGLLTTAIIAVLTYRLMELSGEFFSGIIHPLINIELNHGQKLVKLEDLEFNIGPFKFKIGKVCFAVLKTILVLFFIWLVLHMTKKLETSR